MPNDEPLRVWLSIETKRRLKRHADQSYRPLSLYVRMLIERHLDEEDIEDAHPDDKGRCGPERVR